MHEKYKKSKKYFLKNKAKTIARYGCILCKDKVIEINKIIQNRNFLFRIFHSHPKNKFMAIFIFPCSSNLYLIAIFFKPERHVAPQVVPNFVPDSVFASAKFSI